MTTPAQQLSLALAPTNASVGKDIIIIYKELFSLIQHISKHDFQMIGGDMNGQLGKNKNNKFCIHNSTNRNGNYLVSENKLASHNIKFQKGKTMNQNLPKIAQLYYIFINKVWINGTVNCEGYSSFVGVSSNYEII